MSLNILLSYSISLKVIRNDTVDLGVFKSFSILMSVSRTAEIFSVKEWRDLEIGGRDCSRSLKMVSFDKPYTTFYWSAIVNTAPSCTVF